MILKKGLFFFMLLLGIDLLSKHFAMQWIPPMSLFDRVYPFGGIPVFETEKITFSLNYVINTGAAWGILSGYSTLLFFVRSLVIVALIVYLIFFQKKNRPNIALWFIVTGAIGNAIDYLLYGHVIDFFHFTFWDYSFPIFNFADAYITLGAIFLLVFKGAKEKQIAL